MPTFPNTVSYGVNFKDEPRADVDITGTPGDMTIDVSWNGVHVYGPAPTNAAGQTNIPVDYTAGASNTLRIQLTDGTEQPYSKSGITGQPGQSSSGTAPQV